MSERELLRRTAEIAADFVESLERRPVWPSATVEELRAALGGPLQDHPIDALEVIEELAREADPGVVAMAGGRYFGFVIGGSTPAALAADWLTSTWDQNAGLVVGGPAVAVAEDVAGAWLVELFGFPARTSVAFVTGCQMAHVTCLAAARHEVLDSAGWDVERLGLTGAPPVRVFAGGKRHVTVDRALRLLGFGSESTVQIATDDQGRMRPGALEAVLAAHTGAAIVCAQVGEVNTGAVRGDARDRSTREGCRSVAPRGRRVRALGCRFARAARSRRRGRRRRFVGHRRAQVAQRPLRLRTFVAHPEAHRAAMAMTAEYLVTDQSAARDQMDWTPEFSRRARGVKVYAALRSFGRSGIADLIDRSCTHARRFAGEVAQLPGCELLNDVVLNQVLFRFADDETTNAVLADVQASGEAWMSGTTWDGRAAIRLSVTNWRTTEEDIARTVAAFERAVSYG